MRSATSTRSSPVWLCSLQERTSALTFFRACLLIAGLNELNCLPLLARAPRWRNVNPRNVNSVCSYEARRFPSWQYTIRVLSGCNRSPTASIRSAIAASTVRAWRSLTQCTTASSTYRSNVTLGNLVTAALDMAIANRRPPAGVIFHFDRGAQYTSGDFDRYCEKNGIRRSLGRAGICYDNAVSESTFATYKKELIHTRPWPTMTDLKRETDDSVSYTHL